MSNNDMNKTVREFYKAVEGVKSKKTGGYDVQATVRRVEDGVAWVHIPDGVDETPARLTINAKEGDVVQVRVVNGRAFLVGNASAPPTDNTEAIKALSQADIATEAATIAKLRADEATEDAIRAHDAADSAQASADAAQESADAAAITAGNAQASATTANTAANNALQGLSTVESVVDVVNWFADHKTASTDTVVDPTKTYYSYDAVTGQLTKLDPDGTENPSALGWFEMSDAIADYVATHVATTNDGLSVLSSVNGWRVLISSGGGNYTAGVYLIDPNGNVAQKTTINGVEFNTGRPVKIGDQTAYINFDGNGHISVIGADLTIGGANNVSGTLTVKDASGNTIGTWNKDGLTVSIDNGSVLMKPSGGLEIVNSAIGTADAYLSVINNAVGRRVSVFSSELGIYDNNASYFNPVRLGGWGNSGDPSLSLISSKVAISGTSPTRYVYRGIELLTKNSSNDNFPHITLTGSTTASNSYGSINPQLIFQNSNASQNIALIFTDSDTVQAPASLTLAGNQGGEYFIAPNIKIKDGGLTVAHSDSSETSVRLQNNNHAGSFAISSGGSLMLWSVTNQAALIQMNVSGAVTARCIDGTNRGLVGSAGTDGYRVSYIEHASATTVRIHGQKGTAGADFSGWTTLTGTSGSDIRLKRNIKPVEVKALPLINSIEMKSFDWIPGQRDYTHQPIGMIADQIEKLDSRLVIGGGYDPDGTPNYKVIDVHYLVCYLTKAIQELSAELERMKAS